MTIHHAVVDTATLGRVTLVARQDSMTGLFFEHHHPRPEIPFGERVAVEDDELLARAAAQLDEYAARSRREFDLPLDPAGDAFLRRVWSLVEKVPYGSTTTYGAIAQALVEESGGGTIPSDGPPAKMVGQAVARNPLSVLIPCHRVVAASGALAGYAGGVRRKQQLLELERGMVRRVAGAVPAAGGSEQLDGWW